MLEDPLTRVTGPKAIEVADDPAAVGQRIWIHHGLPSTLPGASAFYQAFAVKPDFKTEVVTLALAPAVTGQIRLSEPVFLSALSNPVPNPAPDLEYSETPFPSVELRILSAFRIWGVIHNFFGYKDLMDEDWDAVFADSLPRFIAARMLAPITLL